jgi:hypothetical protein
MLMIKNLWILFSISLIFIVVWALTSIYWSKSRYSDRFLHELTVLGRASLEYYEIDSNASSLSTPDLFRTLKGENDRSISYLDKDFGRTIRLFDGMVRGPNMEQIEIFFGNSEVVVVITKEQRGKSVAGNSIVPLDILRVTSQN